MDTAKIDRRVRKTKRQLRTALTTLMMEKSVGDITVREISELADVNRGTFYAHYKDVYDLLSQVEENVFVRIEEVTPHGEDAVSESGVYRYLENVFALCGDNADIYRALICRNGDIEFQERLTVTLKNQYMRGFLDHFCTGADERERDLFCSFLVSGMLSITKEWMESGLKESPRQMAGFGGDFVMRGVQALR